MNITKIILSIIVMCSCISVSNSIAQDKGEYQRKAQFNLFNWPGLIGLGVKGELSVVGDQVRFEPSPKSKLYPHNDRVRSISIEVADITSIRRNVFILIPNRLIIKTRSEGTFRFIIFGGRKKLIDLVKSKQRKGE